MIQPMYTQVGDEMIVMNILNITTIPTITDMMDQGIRITTQPWIGR